MQNDVRNHLQRLALAEMGKLKQHDKELEDFGFWNGAEIAEMYWQTLRLHNQLPEPGGLGEQDFFIWQDMLTVGAVYLEQVDSIQPAQGMNNDG